MVSRKERLFEAPCLTLLELSGAVSAVPTRGRSGSWIRFEGDAGDELAMLVQVHRMQVPVQDSARGQSRARGMGMGGRWANGSSNRRGACLPRRMCSLLPWPV